MALTYNKEIQGEMPLKSAVLRTLLYFDLFQYPLSLQEILENCQQQPASLKETEMILNGLLAEGLVKKQNDFYFVNEDTSIIARRIAGNALAEKFLLKAFRYSRLIARFPFVRGVYLSGSLSKGFMDKDSDIDYFIITAPSRLWLCRTMLIAFKKLFLLNSRKYFCVNYFVDINNMEIPDKNLFTATELIFIYPTYNYKLYEQCMDANSWTQQFYPNKKNKSEVSISAKQNFAVKNELEKLLNGNIGEKLDNWCFRITLKHWKKKFDDFDDQQFDLHLRSRKNVSKHHPQGFQTKVLNEHQQKIKNFEEKYNISLGA